MVGFYPFIPGIRGQSSDLAGLGARVCSLHGAAGNVTHRECHTQGMSPAGMSAHPSATGRGASPSQLWILVILSLSQRCSLALPTPSPPPVPFTAPLLPLSLPSPHSQPLFLICCFPSPRRRQFSSRVLRIHHRQSCAPGPFPGTRLSLEDLPVNCLDGKRAPGLITAESGTW